MDAAAIERLKRMRDNLKRLVMSAEKPDETVFSLPGNGRRVKANEVSPARDTVEIGIGDGKKLDLPAGMRRREF